MKFILIEKSTSILRIFIFGVLSALLPTLSQAQSYTAIDTELDLYCADLPDGTNAVVRVISSRGQHNVIAVDPDEEIDRIRKLMRKLQKDVQRLQKIRKANDPSNDLDTLVKLFKAVNDTAFKGTDPYKIYNQISSMIKKLRDRITRYEEALETIERCRNNEDLIPPPTAGSAEVITFPFTHPDYGTLEIMRGLGVTGTLSKKASSGVLCVSVNKQHPTLEVFPYESERLIRRNPCLIFFQTSFRNFPFCSYGGPNTATAWFSSTEVGFSQSAFDDKEREKLEKKLASYGGVNVRTPTKKKPCRTRK